MIPSQLPYLVNHLWQSTLFAAAAALLTLAFRKNRAQTRYWLWLAASVKFIIPFSLLVDAGSRFAWHSSAALTPPSLSYVIEVASRPFGVPATLATAEVTAGTSTVNWIPIVLYALWAIGSATLVFSWWRRWRGLRLALRTASPLDLPIAVKAMTSPAFAEPGVFGVLRPVLLLPTGITDRLTPMQLEAIMAHEMCHVRRRDNLATAIHMGVEALFWFYPMVWWLGARLMEERERACDEEVLLMGSEPQVYAESILKICELYLESPLRCVSGVTGANLRKRIEGIMSNQIRLRLTFAGKIVLGTAAVAAVTVPIAVGMLKAPAVHAQSAAQTVPGGRKFDIASIKPVDRSEHFIFGIRPMPGGRITGTNVTLKLLIMTAYGPQDFQLSGGPGWIGTARYNIEAKPDSPVGPNEWKEMLKNLLADRFQLAFHRETKQLPVYALVLARKDGKLGPGMVESEAGGCAARDPSKPLGPPAPGQPPFCGNVLMGASQLTATAATVSDITPMLSRTVGRKVIDRTGLNGKYDITLKYTPDEYQLTMMAPPGAPPPPLPADGSGPSLFAALQEQLGLKLEPQKGPVEIFVIDHAERPSEN